jgi:5-formyltetrahydrofolate cyclo-ligase
MDLQPMGNRIELPEHTPQCGYACVKPTDEMNEPAADAKASLRREIRARLRSLQPGEREQAATLLAAKLQAQTFWRQARIVLLFAPLPDEPDLWPLVRAALAEPKQVCLPRFDPAESTYQARPIRGLAELAPGRFGVLEPREDRAAMALNRLDLALVPGVAFDVRGWRLGRGKGFYDRLLAQVPGWKCGVALDEQIVEAVPVGPHDVRLNCILTPTRLIET